MRLNMKPYLQHSFLKRVTAIVLAVIQVLLLAPTAELTAAVVAEIQKPASVRANTWAEAPSILAPPPIESVGGVVLPYH
jgi:hypothetical protein